MKNNNITLSDVERNKELFEYEMTEVILQLKGEFAKVSGKDLHLDNARFATKKLNIQSEIPDISVTPIEIETSKYINSVSGENFALPEVKVLHSKINCPTVPVSASVVLNSVQLEQLKPDCPVVNPVNKIKIGEIKLTVSDVSEPVQKVSVTDLPEVTISSVSVGQVNTKINIPNDIQKIQLDSEKIEVSDVTVNIPPQTDVKIEYFTLKTPTVNKISVPETHDIFSVSIVKIDIPDTVFSISETENISINQIPKFRNLQISTNIHFDSTEDISVPKIFEYNPVSLQNIFEKISGLTKVPDIIPFQEIIMTTVSLNERKSIVNEVHIPVIPKETTGEIKINVNQPDIEFEYPIVDVVNIPPVTVKKIDEIIVPKKVDFSSDIRDILESAV